jgi:hypothetical protein
MLEKAQFVKSGKFDNIKTEVDFICQKPKPS